MKTTYAGSDHERVFKGSHYQGRHHSESDNARVFKPHAMGGPVAGATTYSPASQTRNAENLPQMKKGGRVKK